MTAYYQDVAVGFVHTMLFRQTDQEQEKRVLLFLASHHPSN
jgi:hypothetical protein